MTLGNSGTHKAELSFRTEAGRIVECRYKGNAHRGRSPQSSGGDAYVLERCSDGSKAGQAKRADWFELEVEQGDSRHGPTQVSLRLGGPDVVDGVVQEQVFYSSDPRISGAALHVPRGSAPAFEDFSLSVLGGVPLGTFIANGGDGATSVGYAIDFSAESTEAFAFTPVAGASCPRIELPYDAATLARIAGPDADGRVATNQLLTLRGIASGDTVLERSGPVTVDLQRRTASFCVEHLSFYLATVASWDSRLTGASLSGFTTTGPQTNFDLFNATVLPTLQRGQTYQLTLTFQNTGTGTNWTSGGTTPALIAVDKPTGSYPALSVTPITNSPWGVDAVSMFAPASVVPTQQAAFTFNVTVPSSGDNVLNFCLRQGATRIFGDCFSWDPKAPAFGTPAYTIYANGAGKTNVELCTPVAEACNNIDDDCNAVVDDNVTRTCYEGPAGTAGHGICKSGLQTCAAGAFGTSCVGQVLPGTETCNNLDDDCDDAVDEGLMQGCYDGPPNTLDVGVCHGGTQTCSAGSFGACTGQVTPGSEVCDGLDNDCNGAADDVPVVSCGSCGGTQQCGACSVSTPSNFGAACGCNGTGTIQCDGTCSVGECVIHRVFFKAANVDDQVVVANGRAVEPPPFGEGVFLPPPIFDCIGKSSGGPFDFQLGAVECQLSPPFPQPGWLPWRNGQVLTDDGRVIFTLSLINSGCFDTQGDFSIVIDDVEIHLSRQGKVLAHCGVTHQQTFIVDFVNGTVEIQDASVCFNDGDCLAAGN